MLLGAVAAAACSDPSTAPTDASGRLSPAAPSAQGAPSPDVVPDRHIHPPHGPWSNAGNALYIGTPINGRIFYRGGPVLQAGTNVVAVYWANSTIYVGGPTPGTRGTGAQDGSLMGLFLRSIGGSPYFNINTSYTDASGAKIKNVVNYTGFWANNNSVPANGASVSDAQMISMLQSGFNAGSIAYDPSTLYIIFSAGTVNLGGGFGTQYCAYHTHGTVTINGSAKTVLYSAMPYNAASSSCIAQNQGPNYATDPGVDPEVSVVAHETEETTTDMLGNAWFDNRGWENADKCAWTWGTTQTAGNGAAYNLTLGGRQWLVQRNWIASNGGCAMSY
ncbi:phosphate-responsive 1 family protein (plasmid) [Gemmatirosa kalamazoonensis]|uniref:Phosphate-responsive 1 family protein n=2 Tax=Gemmatirosa kalamazoonensis TaxID=861299 RepID=W0RS04_9BACT|nr:phosphate-responsive 1 family protein [Gemmatirosa kalamazoonensis]